MLDILGQVIWCSREIQCAAIQVALYKQVFKKSSVFLKRRWCGRWIDISEASPEYHGSCLLVSNSDSALAWNITRFSITALCRYNVLIYNYLWTHGLSAKHTVWYNLFTGHLLLTPRTSFQHRHFEHHGKHMRHLRHGQRFNYWAALPSCHNACMASRLPFLLHIKVSIYSDNCSHSIVPSLFSCRDCSRAERSNLMAEPALSASLTVFCPSCLSDCCCWQCCWICSQICYFVRNRKVSRIKIHKRAGFPYTHKHWWRRPHGVCWSIKDSFSMEEKGMIG